MARRPWFPLYVPDYLCKTGHLDGVASGAYLHLLMHQWMHGSIPADDESLRRIVKLTPHLWNKCKREVLSFFQQGINLRLKHEMDKAEEISEKRSNAAMQMHVLKQSKSTHNHNHSNNNKEESKKEDNPRKRGQSIPQGFPDAEAKAWAQEFWLKSGRGDLAETVNEQSDQFQDYHIGKGTTSKDWGASWRTWARNAKKFTRQERVNERSRPGHESKQMRAAGRFLGTDSGNEGEESSAGRADPPALEHRQSGAAAAESYDHAAGISDSSCEPGSDLPGAEGNDRGRTDTEIPDIFRRPKIALRA